MREPPDPSRPMLRRLAAVAIAAILAFLMTRLAGDDWTAPRSILVIWWLELNAFVLVARMRIAARRGWRDE